MGRAIAGLFAQIIIATTVFTMNMFFVSIAGLLRLLPVIVPFLGRVLWALVILSCRLYYLVLTRAAPFIEEHVGIKMLEGLWRIAATVSLSLILGVVFLLLTHLPISVWTIIPLLLHGLFVDFIWDEIPDTGGLQIGIRL